MRLIDADALLKAFYRELYNAIMFGRIVKPLQELIKEASSVDAVPVVRCKDCVWYVRSIIKQDGTLDERYKPDWCDLYRREREETYFCADGERRDDDTD